MNNSEPVLPLAAVQALQRGSKIAAIKYVSGSRGTSLRQSRAIVEQYLESRPDMKRHLLAKHSMVNIGGLVLFIIIALGAYYGFIAN